MEVGQRLIRQFIPRPPTAEDLAIFTLCLESLPQFEPVQLHLVNGPEVHSLVYPSQEFKTHQWLCIDNAVRWQSESEAIEWAYEILDGQTIEALSFFKIPAISEGERHITLCAWKSEHMYTTAGQDQRITIFDNPLSAKSKSQGKQLSYQEIEFMRYSFQASAEQSAHLRLWSGGLLKIAEREDPAVLRDYARAFSGSLPLVTFSTSNSQVLSRMAGQLLGREPMVNISDAQVLNSLVPWGSRSLIFHHEIQVDRLNLLFNFCYLKPLATYAPIRVEFLASHPQGDDVQNLFDRLLAHFILNPNTIT